jgi:hypothetical protein
MSQKRVLSQKVSLTFTAVINGSRERGNAPSASTESGEFLD